MAVQQTQQELVGLVNDLAQLNFQQALAIKQLYQRCEVYRRQFTQQFYDYRKNAEQRITDLQQSYSTSLMNVLKNRAILTQADTKIDMITIYQHDLYMSSQRLQFEKQLRYFDEECSEKIYNLVSIRDNMRMVIDYQNIYIKAQKCYLDLLGAYQPQGRDKAAFLYQTSVNQSTDDFYLKYSISAATNTVYRSGAYLEYYQHNNVEFTLQSDAGSTAQLSAEVIPWLLASETAQRVLSNRHARLLQTLHYRDYIISQLSDYICRIQSNGQGDGARIYQLQSYCRLLEERRNTAELAFKHEIEQLQQRANAAEVQAVASDAEKRVLHTKCHQQQHQLELYEAQIRNSRDMYFAEFQQFERMAESGRIGYLQNQVIYLSNFEKIYAKTLSDISRRNLSLSESNEELRMYNIQFNARLNEVQAEAQRKVDSQYQLMIYSYEQAQNTYLRENSYLRFALDQKCAEIQQIQTFESTIKQTVEDLRAYNAHLCALYREQLTYYENMHARYRTLRRQCADCILSRQDAKEQYNGMADIISAKDEYYIKEQTQCQILINAMAVKLVEYVRSTGRSTSDFLREVVAGATAIEFDKSLAWIWQFAAQTPYAKLAKQNLELTEIERCILEEREFTLAGVALYCDFTYTDERSIEIEAVAQAYRPYMLDACQQVTFHTDQSQLLKEAYREINSLNQQLSDYNYLMKRFGSIKQKIFEECYYDDIEMVRQCKESTALAHEDLNAQMYRYVRLVDHWNTHKCPTFETYRPIVDEMLDKLRQAKDAEIGNLTQRLQFLSLEIDSRDTIISHERNTYYRLANYLRDITFENGSVRAVNDLIVAKTTAITRYFNRLDLQLELTAKAAAGAIAVLRQQIKNRDDAEARRSRMDDKSSVRAPSSLADYNRYGKRSTHHLEHISHNAKPGEQRDVPPTVPKVGQASKAQMQDKNAQNVAGDRDAGSLVSKTGKYREGSFAGSAVNLPSRNDSLVFDNNTSLSFNIENNKSVFKRNNSFAVIAPALQNEPQDNWQDISLHDSNAPLRRCASQIIGKHIMVGKQYQIEGSRYCESISSISSEEPAEHPHVISLEDRSIYVETLREDLFHSLYLEQFTMMREEIGSAQRNGLALHEQLANKNDTIGSLNSRIQQLLEELEAKKKEIEYNFVHRPSREEDIAMMRKQQYYISYFKEWYLMSLSDNYKLIDQINKSEKEIQNFFGTGKYNVNPNSTRNDMANFTKEQLIYLRKNGQTKIDKLFAVYEYGGLSSMKVDTKQAKGKSIIPPGCLEQYKINMQEAELIRKLPHSTSYGSIHLAANPSESANYQVVSMAEQKSQSSTINYSLIDTLAYHVPDSDATDTEELYQPAVQTTYTIISQQPPDRLVFEGHQKYPAKEFQYLFSMAYLPPRIPPILPNPYQNNGPETAQVVETHETTGPKPSEATYHRSKSLISTLKSYVISEDYRENKELENKRLRESVMRGIRQQRSSSNLAENVPENMLRSWKQAHLYEYQRKAYWDTSATRTELSAESIVRSQQLDYVYDLRWREYVPRSYVVAPNDAAPQIVDIPPLSVSYFSEKVEKLGTLDKAVAQQRDEPWQVGHVGQISRELKGKRSGLVKYAGHLPGTKK